MKKVKFGAIVKHIIDRLELLLKGGFIKKDLKIYNALNTMENFKYNKEKKFFRSEEHTSELQSPS